MYRHFPTRRELIIAVYADEATALCAQGEALLDNVAAGDALFGWLRLSIAHVATKRALALAIPNGQGGQRSALFDRWRKAMHSTASALLTRAQRSGTIRTDVEASDLLALANGIALTGADTGQAGRARLVHARIGRCSNNVSIAASAWFTRPAASRATVEEAVGWTVTTVNHGL